MTEAYFGGIPTGPDVKLIREKFADEKLKPGKVISYEQIGELVGVKYGEARFTTITNAWRKAVRLEANIIISVIAGQGFIVLNENEKTVLVGRKIRRSVKQLRSGYKVMQTIDTGKLNVEGRNSYDFNSMRMGKMIAMSRIKPMAELPTMEDKQDG